MNISAPRSNTTMGTIGWVMSIAFWVMLFLTLFAVHVRLLPADPADVGMIVSGAILLTEQYWYIFTLPAVIFAWGTAVSVRAGQSVLVALFKWATIAACISCIIVVLLVSFSLIFFFS